ncbi:MAG: hypothetical protein K2X27_24325 [Candidatus Obscuribacterales bacterium]|nr:hypothetical protein [Candidatus Obscuribacterales bacterium]
MNSVRESHEAACKASRRSYSSAIRFLNRTANVYRESTKSRLKDLRDSHQNWTSILSDSQRRYAESQRRFAEWQELTTNTYVAPAFVSQAELVFSNHLKALEQSLESQCGERDACWREIQHLEGGLVGLAEIKSMIEASDSLETASAALRKSKRLNYEFGLTTRVPSWVQERLCVRKDILRTREEIAKLHSRIEAMRDIVAKEQLADCLELIAEAERHLRGKREFLKILQRQWKSQRRTLVSMVGVWGFFFEDLQRCLWEWEECLYAQLEAKIDLEAAR